MVIQEAHVFSISLLDTIFRFYYAFLRQRLSMKGRVPTAVTFTKHITNIDIECRQVRQNERKLHDLKRNSH